MQLKLIPAITGLMAMAASVQSATLDNVLEEAVTAGRVPGVVAMIASADEVLYAGAFGHADVGSDLPMVTDSVFRIASMTKPLTSVAALQLSEKGKVALDAPMSDYLPDFSPRPILLSAASAEGARYSDATYTPTLRQLLSHSSGFVYSVWNELLFSVTDLTQVTPTSYRQEPLLFVPGSEWHYSTSTDWLGDIVEQVSGLSLEEYFAANIVEPLGMRDTAYNLPQAKWKRVVTRHQRSADGLVEAPTNDLAEVTHFSGGAGLKSTAADYVRFMQAMLGSSKVPAILQPDTIAAMGSGQIGDATVGKMRTQIPSFSNDFLVNPGVDSTFGLGFQINTEDVPGGRRAGSLAWAGLYNTYFWIDPESDLCGVLLTQILPFYDAEVVDLLAAFEREAYRAYRSN
ncbi:MAG: serine hydrolase domain-containing protein [Pseudomonadota bacterium]